MAVYGGCQLQGERLTIDIRDIRYGDHIFTQHPKVKAAAIAGIEKYGTGAGASPLIGGIMNIT